MARILGSEIGPIPPAGNLIGSDPGALQTAVIPVKKGQGVLLQGTLLDKTGTKAIDAATTYGVLAEPLDTVGLAEDSASTVYTSGRFVLEFVQQANPEVTLDDAARVALRAKNITFEKALY
jgi:hypothetical protein